MTRIPVEKHYSTKKRMLDWWIRLANLLPPQEPLPEPPVVAAIPVLVSPNANSQPGWMRVPATTRGREEAIEKVRNAWDERLLEPVQLRGKTAWASPVGGTAVERYEVFYRVRETLRSIVKEIRGPAFKRPATRYGTVIDAEIRTFGTQPRTISLVGGGIFLSEDSYGVFLRVLEQAGEEIYRLKFCPVCRAIFQPRRKDQRACAPRCANVLRVREQREFEKKWPRAKDRKQKKRGTSR
jgi:hypothetical protein